MSSSSIHSFPFSLSCDLLGSMVDLGKEKMNTASVKGLASRESWGKESLFGKNIKTEWNHTKAGANN